MPVAGGVQGKAAVQDAVGPPAVPYPAFQGFQARSVASWTSGASEPLLAGMVAVASPMEPAVVRPI